MRNPTFASFTVNCYDVLLILTHPFTDTGSEFQHVPKYKESQYNKANAYTELLQCMYSLTRLTVVLGHCGHQ